MEDRWSWTCTAGTAGRSGNSDWTSARNTTGIPVRGTTSTPVTAINTLEFYVGARFEPFSAKYSHAVTNLFGMKTSTVGGYCGINTDGTPATADCLGTGSTKGSGYLDLGAAFDVVLGMNLTLHYGYQSVRNYPDLSYADYKIGLTRQFGGITLGAGAVGTNAE